MAVRIMFTSGSYVVSHEMSVEALQRSLDHARHAKVMLGINMDGRVVMSVNPEHVVAVCETGVSVFTQEQEYA